MLDPNSVKELTVYAVFTTSGSFDVNQWKLNTSLSFPKSLIDQSIASKLKRTGSKFLQLPTLSQMIYIS
jgi:hypothetical protein